MNHSGEFTYPDTKTPANRTYWVVQGKLLAGAYPGQPELTKHLARLQSLYDAGMRTFVNLQEEGEKNKSGQTFVRYDGDLRDLAATRSDTVSHLRFPIPDGGTTSVDRMRSILDAIDLSLAANRAVYVHCFGGMGRTGMAISLWEFSPHGQCGTKVSVLGCLATCRERCALHRSHRQRII